MRKFHVVALRRRAVSHFAGAVGTHTHTHTGRLFKFHTRHRQVYAVYAPALSRPKQKGPRKRGKRKQHREKNSLGPTIKKQQGAAGGADAPSLRASRPGRRGTRALAGPRRRGGLSAAKPANFRRAHITMRCGRAMAGKSLHLNRRLPRRIAALTTASCKVIGRPLL